ncbi:Hypothetical_protein [Hexamita inflata]|uniref:Hypothetical_protein n=1 Tax=Hexamita inflata TaxID=28002 RepID=A0AA86NFV5_9EUKA|nr:Hypothetical protein HINF_LOCUS5978 [Hexamita inflata]
MLKNTFQNHKIMKQNVQLKICSIKKIQPVSRRIQIEITHENKGQLLSRCKIQNDCDQDFFKQHDTQQIEESDYERDLKLLDKTQQISDFEAQLREQNKDLQACINSCSAFVYLIEKHEKLIEAGYNRLQQFRNILQE